jgi:hypothetical protein
MDVGAMDGATSGPLDAGPSDGRPSVEGGDASARPYRLSTGGPQLIVSGTPTGLLLQPSNAIADVDVLDIHQEYYGVPWDTFLAGQPPPPAWVSVMDSLAATAKSAHKPVFLSVSMLDGGRTKLADKTVVSGSTITTQSWSTACFDFATDPTGPSVKAAYLAYVAWMIDEFSPAYLDHAIEINLFFEACPSQASALVEVANATYDAVKAKSPSLLVFPSFQLEHLYGYTSTSCATPTQPGPCFDANYAQIAPLSRDRFGMSTYPNVLGVFNLPSDVPADWFIRGSSRGGERGLVTETGWSSSNVVAQTSGGTCLMEQTSTEAETAAYLGILLAAARSAPLDLVDWWDDRDLVVSPLMTNCPCTFDTTWCQVLGLFSGPPVDAGLDTYFENQVELKVFGAMGLRDYSGNPKPTTYPLWASALAEP